MPLIDSLTEITTGATDAVLAVECLIILVILWRSPADDPLRRKIWCSVFGIMAFSSILGAAAHIFEMPQTLRDAIWKPLYLSLGLLVSIFLAGVILDLRGHRAAKRFLPWSIGLGIFFFGLTELSGGEFIIFVAFEAAVMLAALAVYIYLGANRRLKGAGMIAAAIILNLAGGAIQASTLSIHVIFPFDHNGVFHLVQMIGTAVLGFGLSRGMVN